MIAAPIPAHTEPTRRLGETAINWHGVEHTIVGLRRDLDGDDDEWFPSPWEYRLARRNPKGEWVVWGWESEDDLAEHERSRRETSESAGA